MIFTEFKNLNLFEICWHVFDIVTQKMQKYRHKYAKTALF